jgi:hypothetical protein
MRTDTNCPVTNRIIHFEKKRNVLWWQREIEHNQAVRCDREKRLDPCLQRNGAELGTHSLQERWKMHEMGRNACAREARARRKTGQSTRGWWTILRWNSVFGEKTYSVGLGPSPHTPILLFVICFGQNISYSDRPWPLTNTNTHTHTHTHTHTAHNTYPASIFYATPITPTNTSPTRGETKEEPQLLEHHHHYPHSTYTPPQNASRGCLSCEPTNQTIPRNFLILGAIQTTLSDHKSWDLCPREV